MRMNAAESDTRYPSLVKMWVSAEISVRVVRSCADAALDPRCERLGRGLCLSQGIVCPFARAKGKVNFPKRQYHGDNWLCVLYAFEQSLIAFTGVFNFLEKSVD